MRQFLIDAFATAPFRGNQACVVEPLGGWPPDAWMQALAQENNQAETAYLVPTGEPGRYRLRWFTPALEVPLCGHATLAAAHALWTELGETAPQLVFDTLSGPLIVERAAAGYRMDFPADPPRRIDCPDGLEAALGIKPAEVWAAGYLVAVLPDEASVRALAPDIAAIKEIGVVGDRQRGNLICAAPADAGTDLDVVSRFFAPGSGIAEDPATGSAHCILAPLFAAKLGRDRLRCYQAYPGRGGEITCTVVGDRVLLDGQAVTINEARLRILPA